MANREDLTGKRFGRLEVVTTAPNQSGRVAWKCQCDCGSVVVVRADNLRSGNTQSCGCLFKEADTGFRDFTGKRFGRLVVINQGPKMGVRNRPSWNCQCDCGNLITVRAESLTSKDTRSCGCLHKDIMTKHGLHKLPIYAVWSAMKARCSNKNHKAYKRYGGRGITVCSEWLQFEPFYSWASENGYVVGLDLDRIDNDGNYEPLNCRFSTHAENTRNTGRTRRLTYMGRTQSLSEWAIELGINDETLRTRLDRGWGVERAFTAKVKSIK